MSRLCGGKFIDKNDDEDMPATLIFHVADVDIEKIKDYMLNNRDEFHSETRFDLIDNSVILGCSGFFTAIKTAELVSDTRTLKEAMRWHRRRKWTKCLESRQ